MNDICTLSVDHSCLQQRHIKDCMLHCAIVEKSDIAMKILERGRCLGATNSMGMNSLHLAARYGHEGALARLLDCGLRVDDVDSYGNQPLLLAAIGGHMGCFERLIKAGAYINHANSGGNQVSHIVAMHNGAKMLERLIELSSEEYIEFNTPNRQGMTPYHLAVVGIARDAIRLLTDLFSNQKRYSEQQILVAA